MSTQEAIPKRWPALIDVARREPSLQGLWLTQEQQSRITTPGRYIGGPWVLLQAWARDFWTCFLLGPEGARITKGYSDWQQFERPRRTSITEWRGRRNVELTIDGLYDQLVQRRNVEYELKKLEDLAEGAPGRDDPTIKVFGAVPRAGRTRWCIDDLEWGDCERNVHNGLRRRQQVTVKLLEWVEPQRIIRIPEQRTQWYTIRKGDNLMRIAAALLGKSSRWREIEKLNKGMRGWAINFKKFPVGKRILVPAR